MAAFIASAAIVAATVSTAQGMYVQQERYDSYYAVAGLDKNNFFSGANPIAVKSPEARVNSFEPSAAERSFLDRIDFAHVMRPLETRIYTGIMEIPESVRDGADYYIRLTSDDAAHMFLDGELVIDNGGAHPPVTKHTVLKLKKGRQYHMQLWWGNAGGPSMLKLEYCRKVACGSRPEGLTDELMDVLSGDARDILEDDDLADGHCQFDTDLRSIFKKHHEVPTVKRCDYDGYFKYNPEFFKDDNLLTRWLPDGCVEEAGGIIALTASDKGVDKCTQKSFTFTTTIAARMSGMHTFWVQSDDASSLFLDRKMIVDNPGFHGPRWKKGTVYLEKDDRKQLVVMYGNSEQPGMLKVMWEDHLLAAPQQSLLPIMV